MNKKILVGLDQQKRRVYLEIEIKRENKEAETIDHRKINAYDVLSISGFAQYRPTSDYAYCGQIYDEINSRNISKWIMLKSDALRIVEIWKRWHLNDMQAGCKHQKSISANDPDWSIKANRETNKCPKGYKYGTAWLVEELPITIINELQTLTA